MSIRCSKCSQFNQPDADGRVKPWCARCGAALAGLEGQVQLQMMAATTRIEQAVRYPSGAGGAVKSFTGYPRRKPSSPSVIFGIGLFMLGLGVVSVVRNFDDFVHGWASSKWPKTTGVVSRSWVEDYISNKGSKSYELRAVYQYEVGGIRYQNDTIHFSKQLQSGDHAIGERELAKIAPVGKPCTVYYDPNRPTVSCLVPGVSVFYLTILPFLTCFFFLVGGVCTWTSVRKMLASLHPPRATASVLAAGEY
jgi:hypothetical protein